jgi:hypothetical protein
MSDTFSIVFRRALLYTVSNIDGYNGKEGLQFANTADNSEIYLEVKERHNLITIKGITPCLQSLQEKIHEIENFYGNPVRKYAIVISGLPVPNDNPFLPRGFYLTDQGIEYGYIPSIAIRYDDHDDADEQVDTSTIFLGAMSFDLLTDLKERVSLFFPVVHVVGYKIGGEEEIPIYQDEQPISSFYNKGITFIFGNVPHPFECLM